MIKVAMVGAGSVGFTRRLLMDILAVPDLRDTEFRLMDISEENLEMASNLCRKMIEDRVFDALRDGRARGAARNDVAVGM